MARASLPGQKLAGMKTTWASERIQWRAELCCAARSVLDLGSDSGRVGRTRMATGTRIEINGELPFAAAHGYRRDCEEGGDHPWGSLNV